MTPERKIAMRQLAGLLILCAALAGKALADEPGKVALASSPLASASVVLSASSFNEGAQENPIVYYIVYGSEVILPRHMLAFSQKNPRQTLNAGPSSCPIEYRDGGFVVTAGDKTRELVPAGLGYQSLAMPVPGDPSYLVAFPRGGSHEDGGRLYYRSGSCRSGTVDGVGIRLYDDDLDGRYVKGKDGLSVGDVGGMGIFGTLQDVLPTPNAAYQIREVAPDGSSVTLDKYAGATGRLKMSPIANVECRLAFASEDGKCSFGTLVANQGLTLPAGKYRFLYGFVYRPAAKHVVGLVLPRGDLPVVVGKDEDVTLTLGDLAKQELPWGEGVVSMSFQHLLELDMTPIEAACGSGDYAKGQKLFDEIAGKHKTGLNRDVTNAWMEQLRQVLAMGNSPEGIALRDAEEKVMEAFRDGKLKEAGALVGAAQEALKKIPANFATGWPYLVHKARLASMSRYAAGTAEPGLRVTNTDHRLRPKGDVEVAEMVDWVSKAGNYYGKIYDGFLVVPKEGEYELALQSASGARLTIDNNRVIDHWGDHIPEERTTKLKLTEGPHPLKIEMYATVGTFCLHLRWTPPGERRTLVPAWALEYRKKP
jgi:hypothetical protein